MSRLAYADQFLSGRERCEASSSRSLLRLSAEVGKSHMNGWLVFKHLGLRERHSWGDVAGARDRGSCLHAVGD